MSKYEHRLITTIFYEWNTKMTSQIALHANYSFDLAVWDVVTNDAVTVLPGDPDCGADETAKDGDSVVGGFDERNKVMRV